MADICNSPKGDILFPYTGESIQKKLNVDDDSSIIEKRAARLQEFVNALVNGDEISQLFIKNDLTEKAKEELVLLQEAVANNRIAEAKKELVDLENKKSRLNDSINELRADIGTLTEEKKSLKVDVEALKKSKELLNESLNNNLSQILSSDIETLRNVKSRLVEDINTISRPSDIKDGDNHSKNVKIEKIGKKDYLPFVPYFSRVDVCEQKTHRLFDDDLFTSDPGPEWHL